MFYPGFADPVHLLAKGTSIPHPGLRSLNTMLSFMVLLHTLLTSELLTTVRACNLPTLYTSLCVNPVHFSSGQDFTTLITGEFLAPVNPHMDHEPVMCFESHLTYGTNLGLPGHRRDLIGDLCNLPGLGTFWEIFPMNKARYLLLNPFQSPFFTTTSSCAG